MTKEQEQKYEAMLQTIHDIDNDDENIEALKAGAEYWCSNYDLCEGYKHAIRLCLIDQYENHASEQDDSELDVLTNILTGKIKMENNDDVR